MSVAHRIKPVDFAMILERTFDPRALETYERAAGFLLNLSADVHAFAQEIKPDVEIIDVACPDGNLAFTYYKTEVLTRSDSPTGAEEDISFTDEYRASIDFTGTRHAILGQPGYKEYDTIVAYLWSPFSRIVTPDATSDVTPEISAPSVRVGARTNVTRNGKLVIPVEAEGLTKLIEESLAGESTMSEDDITNIFNSLEEAPEPTPEENLVQLRRLIRIMKSV